MRLFRLIRDRFTGNSLRKKSMLLFTAMILAFILVVVISTLLIRTRTDRDTRQRTAGTAVNNVVSMLNSSVENYNYISRLIMVNNRVTSFLKTDDPNKSMIYEACMGMYEIINMYSSISYIDSIYIFRNDGVYSNTGKKEYIVDYDSPEWDRILDAKGARVLSVDGNGMLKRADGTITLTFARAIYDIYTQERLGILVMNISSTTFDEVFSLQDESEICIVDNDGTYLCGNVQLSEEFGTDYNVAETAYHNAVHNHKFVTMAGREAIDPLVVMCRTYNKSSVLPFEIILASVLTLGLFALSTIQYALFVRDDIARPIRSLNETMERTKSSGWMERIDRERLPDNEIGQLAASYNSMIEYLNELFDRLKGEEENIRKAEMRVLQEQIKPHFLYNTLETISYIAYTEHAPQAQEALETLGSFYRNFLSKGDREISFRNELQITKDYLTLQKLRYGETFEDEYDIDEAAYDCYVPKLILQPLVENSIYHGVRLKGECCVIRITARKEEHGLKVRIYDSGVGMDEEEIRKALSAEPEEVDTKGVLHGFGLKGTIGRIRYFCNNEDAVRIRSEKGEYTEVELEIPDAAEISHGEEHHV